jgi:hypothetical protein
VTRQRAGTGRAKAGKHLEMAIRDVREGFDPSVTLEIQVTDNAPREARATLARAGVGRELDGEVRDDLLLIIAEALANASRRSHAAPKDERAIVRLEVSDGAVRGEVRNGRLGFDLPLPTFLHEGVPESLYVIDRLSDAWGLEFSDGARLWFELHPKETGAAAGRRT